MLAHRVRVYPGICASSDTLVDIYIDACEDVALHPLYSQREVPFQPGHGVDKQRHRSMPVHRLVREMASNLNLEPESFAQEDPRGARASRPNMELDVTRLESTLFEESVSIEKGKNELFCFHHRCR